MKKIEKLSKNLSKITSGLIGGILLLLMILLFVNVISRYVFSYAFCWAEEVTLYGLVWMVFLGLPVLSKANKHIKVDLISNYISEKANKKLKRLGNILEIIVAGILCISASILTYEVFMNKQISPAAEIPVWLVTIALPIGFLLSLIFILIKIYNANRPGTKSK